MIEILSSILILFGSAFALLAAVGIVRLPDTYCRMHAATKAGAFGCSIIILGVILAMPALRIIVQGLLIILFFYLTAPVAAHMIGRAAFIRKVPLWGISKKD